MADDPVAAKVTIWHWDSESCWVVSIHVIAEGREYDLPRRFSTPGFALDAAHQWATARRLHLFGIEMMTFETRPALQHVEEKS
jgi:hypothetical protein